PINDLENELIKETVIDSGRFDLDLSHLDDGLYYLNTNARWSEFSILQANNIYWILDDKKSGTFIRRMKGVYVFKPENCEQVKIQIRAKNGPNPKVIVAAPKGSNIYSEAVISKIGYQHDVDLKGFKGDVLKLSVERNGLVNFFHLNDIPPIASFDGNFIDIPIILKSKLFYE
ncbi:MAG: hypothetical protein AAGK97_03565, partial [Bacteroidota bacterium]